jgi:Ca-activated chloride channel family protein
MRKLAMVCFLVVLAGPAVAQKPAVPSDKPYTIAVDVDLVLLNVSVRDKHGRIVSGLSEENFQIEEDGKRQEISEFHPEDIPATVGLIIDNSGSMVNKRPAVIEAAMQFVSACNPMDELFIVNFNDFVSMGLPSTLKFTNSYSAMRSALLGVRADGRTALYDGIMTGLQHLRSGTHQRKALIVLSDGGDNASRSGSLNEVVRLAEQSTATIYTIGIFDDTDRDRNPGVLKRLAKLTGGEAYMPRDSGQLETIWQRIAGGIRHQYTIGYFSTNPSRDGTFRDVKVRVKDKDGKPLEALARPGYVAPE